jgi:dTDP-4-amino-4,6-dideoxygalactose transaminase
VEYLDINFPPDLYRFYDSGTAALAAGVIAVKASKSVINPEVIIPAYGCPDLVSAVLYAGCKPVLVDIGHESPFPIIDQLSEKINLNTIAVIVVDLFGIKADHGNLTKICKDKEIYLIQDSAQGFPLKKEDALIYGDITVFSFGRGKPVSLLGGGCVRVQDAQLMGNLPVVDDGEERNYRVRLRTWIKIITYNILAQPFVFCLIEKMPFLKLGETVFNPLRRLTAMPEVLKELLPANYEFYKSRGTDVQLKLANMITAINSPLISNLADLENNQHQPKLNRYPVLIKNPDLRDRLYKALKKKGLGASKMYPCPLNQLPGMDKYLDNSEAFAEADLFSSQILTLPTHGRVDPAVIQKIDKTIRQNI